jgi:cytochrome c
VKPTRIIGAAWAAGLAAAFLLALFDLAAQSPQKASAQIPQGAAPLQGDAVLGEGVFEKRCTGCHALDQDREGPHLKGVFGRTAGSVPGFDYSGALRSSHIVWDEAALERWLTDPQTMVPGADMDFYVAKPDERADVIEFLKEQSQQADRH